MPAPATTDTAFLKRIIALLLALAGLADRAAGASYPVRFIVLAILRRGEMVARDVVVDEAWDAGVLLCLPARPAQDGSEPIDALQLGLSFRMLALALSTLVTLATGQDHQPIAWRTLSVVRAQPTSWLAFHAMPVHDTS